MADFAKYKIFIDTYKTKETETTNTDFKSYRYFLSDNKPEGYIRLLPASEDLPFIPFAIHKVELDGSYKYYMCPKRTALFVNKDPDGYDCPICEKIAEKNDPVITKAFTPKDRILFYILDIMALSEGDKDPKAFSLASNMASGLVDLLQNNLDLLDIEKGKVVKVIMQRDARGFPRYAFEIINKTIDLNSLTDLGMEIDGDRIKYPFTLEDVYPVATMEDLQYIPALRDIPKEAMLTTPDKMPANSADEGVGNFDEWLNNI